VSKLWKIERDTIFRGNRPIAALLRFENNSDLGWAGFGMKRIGHKDEQSVIEDVKYFWRYKPPILRIQFRSGREIVVP